MAWLPWTEGPSRNLEPWTWALESQGFLGEAKWALGPDHLASSQSVPGLGPQPPQVPTGGKRTKLSFALFSRVLASPPCAL